MKMQIVIIFGHHNTLNKDPGRIKKKKNNRLTLMKNMKQQKEIIVRNNKNI